MAQPDSSTLSVAVTSKRREYLTRFESDNVIHDIQKRIICEARQREGPGPAFTAQPQFEDSVLKFWCDSEHTLNWLKRIVSEISSSTNDLVVKSQSEIKKRTLCIFEFYDKQNAFIGSDDIKYAMCYQNSWIDFDKLEIVSDIKKKYNWIVNFTLPEHQIRLLIKAGRRLSIGVNVADVVFEPPNDGFSDAVLI